jgi:hypothetical protein
MLIRHEDSLMLLKDKTFFHLSSPRSYFEQLKLETLDFNTLGFACKSLLRGLEIVFFLIWEIDSIFPVLSLRHYKWDRLSCINFRFVLILLKKLFRSHVSEKY